VLSSVALIAGCGPGDNSVVRGFYPTVKPGVLLTDAIAQGERAQVNAPIYAVDGYHCSGDQVHVGRHGYGPMIRVSHPPSDPQKPWARPYDEVGFVDREEFARALVRTLPRFYGCKEFCFTFGRVHSWSAAVDSFKVTVDADGRVTSVSNLKEGAD
jgi:hypothetical protein